MNEPDTPFWREQKRWSLVHASMSLAVYFVTRNIILSLLIVYAWESLEFLLSLIWPYFRESRGDSVFGDPLVDALAIFAFWLLDQSTHWDVAFRDQVSTTLRLFSALAILATGFLNSVGNKGPQHGCRPHPGTILYLLAYAAVVFAFYGPLFSLVDGLAASVITWVGIVAFYALFALFSCSRPTTWMRVVFAEVLVVMGSALTFVAFHPGTV